MRKIIFLFLFSAFFTGYSQEWQNICMPGLTQYSDESGNLKVFRSDSTYQSGSDSIFISFPTIKYLSQISCLDTNGGSVLGRRVHKQPGGLFLFFNFWGDTIYLNTMAGLNSHWRFARLSDTSYMQALVTTLSIQTLLGITDSVKEITLQAKNNNHQNISHLLNNTRLLLGKQLGLIQVIDFNDFPKNPTLFTLAGKDAGAIGLQELTPEMIFDFNPSDEFHYSGQMSAIHYFEYHKEIKTILSKEILSAGVIRYTLEICSLRVSHSHPFYYPDTTRFQSVDEVIYNMDSLSGLRWFYASPDEFLPFIVSGSNWSADKFNWSSDEDYNNRSSRSYIEKTFSPYPSGCWNASLGMHYEYTSGLGETSRWIDVGGGLGSSHSLVYFKKGAEEWGTPVASSCSVLLEIGEQSQSQVRVFPNPVTGFARISFPSGFDKFPLTCKLYDLSGRVVHTGKVLSPAYLFERGHLKAGLYLMVLTDTQEMTVSKIKVILSD